MKGQPGSQQLLLMQDYEDKEVVLSDDEKLQDIVEEDPIALAHRLQEEKKRQEKEAQEYALQQQANIV